MARAPERASRMLRIFLAVFPPPETRQAAFRATSALRRPGDGISWVKEENLHYTLRFLGDLGESGAHRAAEAAREAAAASRAFDAVLGGPGAFPRPERARVLWLGLAEGGAALERLAHDLEAALRRRGFDRADHRFSAHLTLGRVRARDFDARELLAGANVLENAPGSRFTVGAVSVVESTLSPRGSIYRVRDEARLAPLHGDSPADPP